MRIISGNHKGRKIFVSKRLPVRPTTDRAKEGIFNILNHKISFFDLNVLDLFSGTGNISYEFASRGAFKVTSIDKNKHCIDFIKKTSNNLNFYHVGSLARRRFYFNIVIFSFLSM